MPRRWRFSWTFWLAVILLGGVLLSGYLVRHRGPAQVPSPPTGALSTCGSSWSEEITLVYRDGRPSEQRTVPAFYPWGCPGTAAICNYTGEHQAYPDPSCTPGAIMDLTGNRDPAEYSERANQDLICATTVNSRSGEDRRNVTSKTDQLVWKRYDRPRPTDGSETDHFIALSLGGSNNIANLLPQSKQERYDSDEKDKVEAYLARQICRQTVKYGYAMSLGEAQYQMRFKWTELYDELKRAGQIK